MINTKIQVPVVMYWYQTLLQPVPSPRRALLQHDKSVLRLKEGFSSSLKTYLLVRQVCDTCLLENSPFYLLLIGCFPWTRSSRELPWGAQVGSAGWWIQQRAHTTFPCVFKADRMWFLLQGKNSGETEAELNCPFICKTHNCLQEVFSCLWQTPRVWHCRWNCSESCT